MITIAFTRSQAVHDLVHDYMTNIAFAVIGEEEDTNLGTSEIIFESAAHDPETEMAEANEHEESFISGELEYQQIDLQAMVSDRFPGTVLSFFFKAYEEVDEDAEPEEPEVEPAFFLKPVVVEGDPDDWRTQLGDIFKLIEEGDEA